MSRHVDPGLKLFRPIPCIVSDLLKPDLYHTMQIGMLDHIQKWIFHFMKTPERLDKYNAIWLSMPAYHDLTPKKKTYEDVSHSNGKEKSEISRYMLGVVTQYLRGGSPAQHRICNDTTECTGALLECYMNAWYKSDHDATLSYMEDALCHFHTFKDVFSLGWTSE